MTVCLFEREGGGGEREREIELENFIYKDCSLGLVKSLIRGGGGGRGGSGKEIPACAFRYFQMECCCNTLQ